MHIDIYVAYISKLTYWRDIHTYEWSILTSDWGGDIRVSDKDTNKTCLQCGAPVVKGEEYCAKCIYEDAVTMGVVEETQN